MSAPRIVDAAERTAALDPRHSCIVQAPAGSGKTGLLIQRLLRLLARVDRPDEILAITFTRKAAAEMRRRVLEALASADDQSPPADANERLTWMLARDAAARDRECGWKLRENPGRLRVQTIDALCASLARQMPLLSGLGATPAIVEDAAARYREAAERTLAHVDAPDALGEAVRRFLLHLDGDWNDARALLEAMLARREQWIERAAGFEANASARAALEQAFRVERARIMQRVREMMPAREEPEIAALAAYAARNLASSELDSAIAGLATLARYPGSQEEDAPRWRALAELLLTESGAWRLQVNRNTGFPPGEGGAAHKVRMGALLERLRETAGICEALHAVREMPPPAFTDAQWEALGAVVRLLPHAAAHLRVVFAEHGEIDFAGLAQAATAALGDEDHPTDLLLALDVRLRHLLVDEFQDTSRAQWELLKRLTAGWTGGDGRTAFLVGDPMQSIYRFREADVALFLRAWSGGLPTLPLVPLALATNFRSQTGIVEWVNASFARILPAVEDADAGAVPYAASAAHRAPRAGAAVRWHAFTGRDAAAARAAEAQAVVGLVREALAREGEDVAILVRNRSHLDRIAPALKAAQIRFQAVDIEPLATRPVIQDLLAVTRALAHPADRVAWLALLRAPWCGLDVEELHRVAGDDRDAIVWEALHDEGCLTRLGDESRARLVRLRQALRPYVEAHLRGALRERVEGAWIALGGPACAMGAADLEDAETFLEQLDALDEAGDLIDPARLEEHLALLFAAPDAGDSARVQVMTIHKAKGLEFATVIVPGLDRLPRSGERPLFAWKARGDGNLMVAPMRATGESGEPAYDYLCSLEDAAAGHELERLLYVAATRARHELHLLGFARVDEKAGTLRLRKPPPDSLLCKAWSVASGEFERALESGAIEPQPDATVALDRGVRRVVSRVLDVEVPGPAVHAVAMASAAPVAIEFSWAGETARHIGILTHRFLQRIAIEGVDRWNEARVRRLADLVRGELGARGVPPAERDAAARRVLDALAGALADPRGRWVLADHAAGRSEYRLRVARPDGVRLVVIDRTFRDAHGRRWIVDFKTGVHEGAQREAFLDRELERYRPQLASYAAAFPGEDVGLGLYFPLMRAWRELALRPMA